MLVGVGATIADRETSEEVEACTGLARQSRCVCLAERGLEAEYLLDCMTIVVSMRVVIFILF